MDTKTELEKIKPCPPLKTVSEILLDGEKTFSERNMGYGESYKTVPKIMGILFPKGVNNEILTKPEFHCFYMVVSKVCRFANSNLKHLDSIHDIMVYSAMIENELSNNK